MGLVEQQKLKEWLLKELGEQIGQIDEQIAATRTAWDEVSRAQRALEMVEALLKRMSALAREAAENGADPQLSDEFEACKALLGEYSEKAVVGGVNVIWDSESDLRTAINEIMQKGLT